MGNTITIHDEDGVEGPVALASGTRDHGDGEGSCTRWALFSLAELARFDITADDDIGEAVFGGRCYGGPGRGFRDEPAYRIVRGRVLVTQFCGIDI